MTVDNQITRIIYKARIISPPIKVLFWVFVGGPMILLIPVLPIIIIRDPSLWYHATWPIWFIAIMIGVARRTRVVLEVDNDQQMLTLTMGKNTKTFGVAHITEIDIETSKSKTQWRLILVYDDGRREPLTPVYFYNLPHHQQVASELRQAIGQTSS